MKKAISLLLVLAMAVNLAACASEKNPAKDSAGGTSLAAESEQGQTEQQQGQSEQISPTEQVSQTEQPSAKDSHYPVTVTTYDFEGNEIQTTYEKAPEKVLCVYQGCVEIMIALELEGHVAASYGLDNPVKEEWEAGLSKMNYNEDVFAPDKETVLMMEPDLILSWGSIFSDKNLGDAAEWIANGTNTYISSTTRSGGHPRTLENEYADILNIGKIFDVEEKDQAIVDEMKDEIASVLSQTQGQDAPRVAIIEFLNDNITNYGASQLGGDMVTQLGGVLVEPEASSVGKEDLLELDPDVVFVVYMARTEGVEEEMRGKLVDDPAFSDLSAVKNGRVYTIMLGDMYASTVRSIDGIRTFAAGMYPELYE